MAARCSLCHSVRELREISICGHVFCVACLSNYLQRKGVMSHDVFKCPIHSCRMTDIMPAGGAARMNTVKVQHDDLHSSEIVRSYQEQPPVVGGGGSRRGYRGYTDPYKSPTNSTLDQMRPSTSSRAADKHAADYRTQMSTRMYDHDKYDPDSSRAIVSYSKATTYTTNTNYTRNRAKQSNVLNHTTDILGQNSNSYLTHRPGTSNLIIDVPRSRSRQRSVYTTDRSVSPDFKPTNRFHKSTKFVWQITEKKGDLFSSPPHYGLVNCISADVNMDRGIITAFKKRYGGQQEIIQQRKRVGDVAALRRGSRYVYYLITKEKYHEKPSYQSLQFSLYALKSHCEQHGVTDLAMPRIGCGLDGLQWSCVRDMIHDTFNNSNINVCIYS